MLQSKSEEIANKECRKTEDLILNSDDETCNPNFELMPLMSILEKEPAPPTLILLKALKSLCHHKDTVRNLELGHYQRIVKHLSKRWNNRPTSFDYNGNKLNAYVLTSLLSIKPNAESSDYQPKIILWKTANNDLYFNFVNKHDWAYFHMAYRKTPPDFDKVMWKSYLNGNTITKYWMLILACHCIKDPCIETPIATKLMGKMFPGNVDSNVYDENLQKLHDLLSNNDLWEKLKGLIRFILCDKDRLKMELMSVLIEREKNELLKMSFECLKKRIEENENDDEIITNIFDMMPTERAEELCKITLITFLSSKNQLTREKIAKKLSEYPLANYNLPFTQESSKVLHIALNNTTLSDLVTNFTKTYNMNLLSIITYKCCCEGNTIYFSEDKLCINNELGPIIKVALHDSQERDMMELWIQKVRNIISHADIDKYEELNKSAKRDHSPLFGVKK